MHDTFALAYRTCRIAMRAGACATVIATIRTTTTGTGTGWRMRLGVVD